MFEQFGEMLYKSFAYRVEEIEKGKLYLARHTNADRRERWTKVEFEVRVMGKNEEFNCECGQFAHMGMLCGHALKVKTLDHLKKLECYFFGLLADEEVLSHQAQCQKNPYKLFNILERKGLICNEHFWKTNEHIREQCLHMWRYLLIDEFRKQKIVMLCRAPVDWYTETLYI
jgi:hypothetical protein